MTAVLALLASLTTAVPADSLPRSLGYLSTQVHQGYRRQGLLAPALPPYLETLFSTVASLYPDTPLELFLMRLPDGNASALPDGGIYLRQGFLAEIRNAEELIFVLAHEAAHVALEHVAGRCQDDPRLALFSVDVEIEADQEALRRMREADIATGGVPAFLTRLGGGDEILPETGMAARVARIGPQPADDPAPPPVPLLALKREAATLLLSLDRERAVERYLSAPGAVVEPVDRLTIEAELARRRGHLERAESKFRQAIAIAPTAPAAWRGLALTLESGPRPQRARDAWRLLLGIEPKAPDAPLIQAFIAQDCSTPAAAPITGAGRRATFGAWAVRLPKPWRVARSGPQDIVVSPDSIDLTRLAIESQGPAGPCPLSMVLLERLVREWRARPGAAPMTLYRAEPSPVGAVARLGYSDEHGIDWRLDLHAISGPAGRFGARFRAPARNFYPRWAADAAKIMHHLRRRSPGTTAR